MYCPNCGREIPDGSKFCPYCGFEIKGKKEEVRGTRREKRKFFVSIITTVIILTSVFLLIKFLPGINARKTTNAGKAGKTINAGKTTNAGKAITWAKTFGGSDWDEAYPVQQTKDGGYIVGGYTDSFGAGSGDFLVVKLNRNGNKEWAKTFGGSDEDEPLSVQQTKDGGYIIAGATKSFGAGGYDFLIIKLDKSGNINESCDYLKSCSPIVKSISNSTVNCDPAVNLPSVNASSCNIKTSSPDIQETTICKP